MCLKRLQRRHVLNIFEIFVSDWKVLQYIIPHCRKIWQLNLTLNRTAQVLIGQSFLTSNIEKPSDWPGLKPSNTRRWEVERNHNFNLWTEIMLSGWANPAQNVQWELLPNIALYRLGHHWCGNSCYDCRSVLLWTSCFHSHMLNIN